MSSARRLALAFACLAPLGVSGCFALFSLDEFGPPGPDAGVDAPLDVSTILESGPKPTPEAAPPDDPRPKKRVFITSAISNGNLGGTAGADKTCELLASGAGLGSNFKAWVSVDGQNVRKRFFPNEGTNDAGLPDVRLVDTSGRTVAQSWGSLFSSRKPLVPIELNERGVKVVASDAGAPLTTCGPGSPIPVWTNSAVDGTTASTTDDCEDLATNNGETRVGIVSADTSWTSACLLSCDARAHLYCFEQ